MPKMTATEVSLSAGQAAGTSVLIAANANRTSLVIGNNTATDATVHISDASGGYGMPLPAGGVIAFGGHGIQGGPACPTNAIYVGGLAAADKVTVWES
jgi:hypothetical protein